MSTTGTTTKDRIEKQVRLRHPRARVWRALTDSEEFGKWFGCVFTEPFRPGARMLGKVTHPGYEHLTMDLTVERMEPERLFSFRWHPGEEQPDASFKDEHTTLVVFTLEEVDGGTLLEVVESGFDRVPLERRAKAFGSNDQGWTLQMQAIEKHLDRAS